MTVIQAQVVQRKMDALWAAFVNCRSRIPCVPNGAVGGSCFRTAPWYAQQGYDVTICFPRPFADEDVKQSNAAGHWTNQNFVIRLCVLLESHGVFVYKKEIDTSLPGGEQAKLVRDLRNVFAHTSGHYRKGDRHHRDIMSRMSTVLGKDFSSEQDFPLAVDEVLEPLFQKCAEYVTARAK